MTPFGVVRPIPGVPWYTATHDGRIHSLRRTVRKHQVGGSELKPYDNGSALQVFGGNRTSRSVTNVGACVLAAFVGPKPSAAHEVCHNNGDYRDNRISNLRWGTRAENAADMRIHGTVMNGERNPMARLTEERVRAMRRRRAETGKSYKKLAAEFGVAPMTACRACNGTSWKETQ